MGTYGYAVHCGPLCRIEVASHSAVPTGRQRCRPCLHVQGSTYSPLGDSRHSQSPDETAIDKDQRISKIALSAVDLLNAAEPLLLRCGISCGGAAELQSTWRPIQLLETARAVHRSRSEASRPAEHPQLPLQCTLWSETLSHHGPGQLIANLVPPPRLSRLSRHMMPIANVSLALGKPTRWWQSRPPGMVCAGRVSFLRLS